MNFFVVGSTDEAKKASGWLTENYSGQWSVQTAEDRVEVFTQYAVSVNLSKFALETGLRPRPLGSKGVVKFDTVPTPDEYAGLVESVIREQVTARNYTSIESACSYAGSSVLKFKVEGTAFMRWRDLLWYAVDAVGESGASLGDFAGTLPSFESVLAEVQAELSVS